MAARTNRHHVILPSMITDIIPRPQQTPPTIFTARASIRPAPTIPRAHPSRAPGRRVLGGMHRRQQIHLSSHLEVTGCRTARRMHSIYRASLRPAACPLPCMIRTDHTIELHPAVRANWSMVFIRLRRQDSTIIITSSRSKRHRPGEPSANASESETPAHSPYCTPRHDLIPHYSGAMNAAPEKQTVVP